jgi:hypothetical protein
MVRAVTVTFDIDDVSGKVTNVKTHVEGEVKKRTTTKSKKSVEKQLEDVAKITREDGKLVFNNKAMSEMGLTSESRVVIKYEKDSKSNTLFPVIGTDITFNEEGSGNKLTKSQTISFRGNQNITLAEFGDEFTIEEYEDGIWKLISNSKTAETLEEAVELSDEFEPELLTDDDETYEIDELEFKL